MWSRFLVVFLVSLSFSGYSQSIFLRDFKSSEAITNAHIENLRTSTIDIPNRFGEVQLSDYDNDTLLITSVGYAPLFVYPKEIQSRSVYFLHPSVILMGPAEVVSVYQGEERVDNLPNKIEVIGLSKIRFKGPQTSADVLQSSGNVMVQKSQMGGGSPILRGFEANKVLLVVDGVRMNNAIYRSGHIQNAITIDNNILKQAEVMFGPGSVMFGSDALGGVVHYKTRDPLLADVEGETHVQGNLHARISSANQEKTFHADIAVGEKNYGFLTSISKSNYGDLQMGTVRDHGDEDWGLIHYYAGTENGEDVQLENSDPSIQKNTGYEQIDFLQKFLIKANEDVDLSANFQYSTSTEVPRFDKFNDRTNDLPRWAEWYYGPQKRLLASLKADINSQSSAFDKVSIIGAYQNLNEDRIKRRFGKSERTTQKEDVDVFSLNSDFRKSIDEKQTLNYGLELTHNDVESSANTQDIDSGESFDAITRYPNGGSKMTTAAAYLAYSRPLGKKVKFNIGARYSYTSLSAEFIANDFYELPFEDIDFNSSAFTGTMGAVYNVDSTWQIKAVVSSGFRSPNVDDFGKVREKNGFVTVPNDQLESELAYTGELTSSKTLFSNHFKISLTGFYTLLNNAIVSKDWQLAGEDSLLIEGEMAKIVTNLNTSKAVIYGYHAGISAEFLKHFTFKATYNYTFGQDLTADEALGHIPPVFGLLELEYHTQKFRAEINTMFNDVKPLERYASNSTDNLSEALEDGTPAWWTLNLNTSYIISDSIEAQFAVENILDKHYKAFASGISAPGRNFILSLRASF